MTDAPEENEYSRKHYTLDANSERIVEKLAESHHNENSSEAVRASVRFRDRWSTRDKSLPTEIIHNLDQIHSLLNDLKAGLERLEARVEDVERTASDEMVEDLDRGRHKRQVYAALSPDEGRRIDTIAEEIGLQLGDATMAAQELEDNDRIVRTNSEEKEVRFRKLHD